MKQSGCLQGILTAFTEVVGWVAEEEEEEVMVEEEVKEVVEDVGE